VNKDANIFILVDALGWEWVKQHTFLQSVAPYRSRLESVLGYSTAAIPSILTGTYPQDHGRLSLFQRGLGRSPFASIGWLCAMPPALVENQYVRYAAKRITCRLNHFGGWFHLLGVPLRHLPLLDVSEKKNIYGAGGIPGSTSIFDLLEARRRDYVVYSYHNGSNFELVAKMDAELRKREKSFYFLYLDGVDAFLHGHADDPVASNRCLDRYSALITQLFESARTNYEQVRLHVFGDHGMAPTHHYIDVQARLDKLGIRAPRDYLCVLDSTMARFWFFSDRARRTAMSVFTQQDGGQWLSRDELQALGAWFDDHRYGEEIYLMPEGVIIASPERGDIVSRGMHGYHPSTLHSPSAFVSSVDYRGTVNHITDVFRVMSAYV
jgi:type I phosphodiesterase/nucleotide pyrophosphatase